MGLKMIAFGVSDEEKAEITYYAKVKHFGDPSHLARVAIFAYMERNKVGGHRAPTDAGAPQRPTQKAHPNGGARGVD